MLTGQTTVRSLKLSASPIGRALKLSYVLCICSMLSSCRGVGVVQGAGLVDRVEGSQVRLARELPRVYAQRVQEVSDLESNPYRSRASMPSPAWRSRTAITQSCRTEVEEESILVHKRKSLHMCAGFPHTTPDSTQLAGSPL